MFPSKSVRYGSCGLMDQYHRRHEVERGYDPTQKISRPMNNNKLTESARLGEYRASGNHDSDNSRYGSRICPELNTFFSRKNLRRTYVSR